MTRARGCFLVFLAILAFAPTQARGQGLTGVLGGTIKDPQGGVLAGATVRVSSPALIERELQTTSNEKGQFRFPVLAPGTYTLKVDLGTRFTAFRQEGISIGPGASFDIPVVLALAGVTQAVAVEGTTAVAQTSGLETRLKADFIRNVP